MPLETTDAAVELPVLHFAAGLPGFPSARRFVLVDAYDGADGIYALRCLDQPSLEFVVAVPALFFPGYEPELDDVTVARLGLTGAADALLLVILTVPERAADATANLLAPIIVNQRTNAAVQAVLATTAYSVKTPLNAS